MDPGALNHALIHAARTHRNAAAKLLSELGLHPGQEILLMQLWDADHRTQVDLTRALRVEQGTITKIVRRMEGSGFVKRVPSTADRRAMVVSLTLKGRRLQPAVEAVWSHLEELSAQGLSASERKQVTAALETIANNLTAAGGDDTSC